MAFSFSALSKAVIFVVITITVKTGQSILPHNENCDPSISDSCQKGDLIDKSVADCCYTGLITCDATNDDWWDRTVNPAVGDKCQPYACSGPHQFTCGQAGTNSRCVCDDKVAYDILGNRCRCQYWPTAPPHTPAPNTDHTTPAIVTTHATTTPEAATTTPEAPTTTPEVATTTPEAATTTPEDVTTTPEDTPATTPSWSTTEPPDNKELIVIIAVPTVLGVVLLLVVVVAVVCCCVKCCSKKGDYSPMKPLL